MEELKQQDYVIQMDESQANELLDKLLKLSDEELKRSIEMIIDNNNADEIMSGDIPLSHSIIYSNERIMNMCDILIDEYNKI